MPLEQRWRDYLDSWVIEAKAPCEPDETELFILAIAAELDRLRAIETAARAVVDEWNNPDVADPVPGELDNALDFLAKELEAADA